MNVVEAAKSSMNENIVEITKKVFESDKANQCFMKVFGRTLNNFDQKTTIDLEDIVKNSVMAFKASFNASLAKTANEWIHEDEFVILPEGTKYFKRVFDYEICLVEQKPKVRSLYWDCEYGRGRFSLALPYVLFYVIFDENHLCSLSVAFSNKPVKSLKDLVFAPPLNNINGFSPCLGDYVQDPKQSFSERVERLIEV
jgi:hypothetical protein